MKKNSSNENDKNIKSGIPPKNHVQIFCRWFILAVSLFTYIFDTDKSENDILFYVTFSIILVYNSLLMFHIIKSGEKNKVSHPLFAYIDILIVSVFSFQFGGINSDIYLQYYFVIIPWGIFNVKPHVAGLGLFGIITYTAACLYASINELEFFNYWKLISRDLFLLIVTIFVSFLYREVKKYDEMRRKEFKLARTDKLTGLANRHYFDQKLGEEVDYANLTGTPLNVLMFDLDNFKKFNDTYGHVWGDKLLSLFADIIKQNIRKTDIPVRYGGEEFLILMRELDEERAWNVAERIRRQLEKQKIFAGEGENRNRVTVSSGTAQYPKHSGDIKEVLERADKALYHAKEIGKNIVVSYDSIGKMKAAHQLDIDSYIKGGKDSGKRKI